MPISPAHLAAAFAFIIWGLLPLYWKAFDDVGAWDLFGHRLMWSFVTLFLILALRGKLKLLQDLWRRPRVRYLLGLSSLMISANWYLYIYAIEERRVLEASMGYFLIPLINVMMGRLILKETLRPTQWPAVGLAAFAIVLLGFQAGLQHIPWLALALAVTFALYGLVRKLVQVGSLEGLAFETCVVLLPVMTYWYWLTPTGPGLAFETLSAGKMLLLTTAGIMTCTPLILFAYGAKRLPLMTLGFLQYLSPSLKFMCGLLVFKETLEPGRLQVFVLIWIALGWYTLESYYFMRKNKRRVPAAPRA